MKITIKLVILLLMAISVLKLYGENRQVLNLDFETDLSPQSTVKGGKIVKIQDSDNFILNKKRSSRFLHFNGVSDNLEITLSDEARKVFNESFTLEFDFFSPRRPKDKNLHHPGAHSIEIFSALNRQNKTALAFYLNQYNRFTVYWFNTEGQRSQILTSWQMDNYELASVQRGKWYRVSLVYNQPEKTLEIYLDGEKAGETKTAGTLRTIEQLHFGGDLKGNRKGIFSGGIDDISLYSGILHDKRTAEKAKKKNWRRLHDLANEELKSLLLPENPEWAEQHPRMILTPARIEVLKAKLKKGIGPELVKRLINRCDEKIDPDSIRYIKEIPVQSWGFEPNVAAIELALATILTGNKKYADHAIKLVMDFTEKRGYYDVNQTLYSSGEGLVRQMMVVTWTYDWLYQYFTPDQRRKVRLFLLNIAKGTYTFYNGEMNSEAQGHGLSGWVANWTAMSIATLGYSSLAILGETSAPVKLWLDYATFRAAQYGLFAIDKDGCFHEMTSYFAYGAGPILPFMDALYTAGGNDLIMATNFSQFPNFLPYLIYPNSRKTMPLKYSYSEYNGLHDQNSYALALLRQRVRSKQAEWCWQHLHAGQPRIDRWPLFSLIWFEPEKEKVTSPDLPLAKWFKDEGLVAFRSDWTKDAIAGIFMAYPTKMTAHDQCDRGQFNLYGYQGRWIIDCGGRNQPYYSWRDAHNLITVDNKIPRHPHRANHNYHQDAFMTNFCSADTVMTAADADLTQSYKFTYTWGHEKRGNINKYEDPFKNANRKILYMREKTAPPYLLVYDSIQEDEKKHVYTLNLHTAPENEVIVNGDQVEFKQYPVNKEEDEMSYLCWPGERDVEGNYHYTGRPYNEDLKYGYAEYRIKVPVTGKYDLYGFGRSGTDNPGGMNSFFIKLGRRTEPWSILDYGWSKINQAPYELKEGEQVLTVLAREPESRVMKFSLFPVDAGIPIFNKPNNSNQIMIDAGKPDKIVKEFIVGTGEKVPENAIETADAANMTLWQLAPGKGFVSSVHPSSPNSQHIRLQTTTTAVHAQFLNFFYPRKPGMEQPSLKNINKETNIITWKNCSDLICFKKEKEIDIEGIKSDADLIMVRKRSDSVISFVMMNGSYLTLNNEELIKLSGGKGIAGWADDTLTLSGGNVFNFTFKFPVEKEGILNLISSTESLNNVIANGKNIEVEKTDKGWCAKAPFSGNKVLIW